MYEYSSSKMHVQCITTDQVHAGSIYTNLEMECMHVELGVYIDRHPRVCMVHAGASTRPLWTANAGTYKQLTSVHFSQCGRTPPSFERIHVASASQKDERSLLGYFGTM